MGTYLMTKKLSLSLMLNLMLFSGGLFLTAPGHSQGDNESGQPTASLNQDSVPMDTRSDNAPPVAPTSTHPAVASASALGSPGTAPMPQMPSAELFRQQFLS